MCVCVYVCKDLKRELMSNMDTPGSVGVSLFMVDVKCTVARPLLLYECVCVGVCARFVLPGNILSILSASPTFMTHL